MPATATPAYYRIAAACRRLGISPKTYRRSWGGIFTPVRDPKDRPVLDRQEVEQAAQHAGDRDAMVAAVLKLRRDCGRMAG